MVKKVFTIVVVLALTLTSMKIGAESRGLETAKADDKVVATYDGHTVTMSQLEEFVHSSLLQLRQKEYETKSSGLEKMLFMNLQSREAKKLGISQQEYYKQNVTDKVGEPTEEEINSILTQYKDRLPKDENEARKRVIAYLKQLKTQQREEAFKKELFEKAQVKIALEPPRINVPLSGHEPVLGPKDAPITIIEFSEFECPYCAKVEPTVKKLLKEYEGKIKLIFKHFPLEFHQNARYAAELSLCANEQNKFWEIHDWLFANKDKLNNFEEIKKQAKELGLDVDVFTSCVKEKKYSHQIDKDMAVAEELGTTATPSFFINGRLLQGAQPYEKFKEIIEQELMFSSQKNQKKEQDKSKETSQDKKESS
jgi:protein-disulfide isomerase